MERIGYAADNATECDEKHLNPPLVTEWRHAFFKRAQRCLSKAAETKDETKREALQREAFELQKALCKAGFRRMSRAIEKGLKAQRGRDTKRREASRKQRRREERKAAQERQRQALSSRLDAVERELDMMRRAVASADYRDIQRQLDTAKAYADAVATESKAVVKRNRSRLRLLALDAGEVPRPTGETARVWLCSDDSEPGQIVTRHTPDRGGFYGVRVRRSEGIQAGITQSDIDDRFGRLAASRLPFSAAFEAARSLGQCGYPTAKGTPCKLAATDHPSGCCPRHVVTMEQHAADGTEADGVRIPVVLDTDSKGRPSEWGFVRLDALPWTPQELSDE